MVKKPKIILELEKHLGISLTYFPTTEGISRIPDYPNSFSLNGATQITMLSLTDCEVPVKILTSLTHLQILILRNCNLSDVSFLSRFHDLTFLDLGRNNIEDISSLRSLIQLKYVNIANNRVFDLSPLYNQCKEINLARINSVNNPLRYPPATIARRGKDAIVKWIDESLQPARDSISACRKSKNTRLDLGNLSITDLSLLPELFECFHLKELMLSNEWGTYRTNGFIEKRHSNNKGMRNNIFHIPAEIGKLQNLEALNVGGDWAAIDGHVNRGRLTTIEPFLELNKLKYLNISNNKIKGILNINSLNKLEEFIANNNFITHIRSHFHLKSLKHLNLSNNLLNNADFLIKTPNAETIDLHSNKISNLYNIRDIVIEKTISDSKWRPNTINIANNPLDVPNMQVIGQGMESVESFFQQYEVEQSVRIPLFKNDDIKIILVGNSDTGKTSLAERLITGKWSDRLPSTHWMEILHWQPKRNDRTYNIRIFDFGGQEYYHDTHYLFFSSQTAYVLLWNQKTNNYDEREIQQLQKDQTKINVAIQGFPIPYWMESIAYHSQKRLTEEDDALFKSLRTDGTLIKSIRFEREHMLSFEANLEELDITFPKENLLKVLQPPNILITQSKVAKAADTFFLDQLQLNAEYPAIFDFASISVKTGRGMDHFENLLFEMIDNMPITTRECLGTWGAIKAAIEKGVEENQREMTLKEFRIYCNHIISGMPEVIGAGEKSTNALYFSIAHTESYARYLNDIGLILYFPDNEHLKDKVFLRQNDVLKKIYEILEGLHILNGKFNQAHILKALKKKKFDEECTTIIELMKHFKIAFLHPSQEGTFIAPLYLPAQPSKSISIFLDDGHQPSYRFLFQGFIHKHIILEFFHLYGQQALRDEHGQQYYYWKNGIVIKDDLTHGIVMVRFINATASAKAYIDVYSLGKNGDKSLLKKITEELERLTLDMNVKKAVTTNGADFVPVDVIHAAEASNQWIFHYNDQYFDLKLFRAHLKNELKMKKIFISYSKADAHYLQQFENHLSALKRNGSISTWNCRQLLPGEKWDGKIKKELEEADIIIFLVSSDFLATDYIWDIEIKYAIDKENANPDAVKVVPIIIRSCVWEDTPLSAYNTAPKKAQVITLSNNLDEAFTDAVRDLKKIL